MKVLLDKKIISPVLCIKRNWSFPVHQQHGRSRFSLLAASEKAGSLQNEEDKQRQNWVELPKSEKIKRTVGCSQSDITWILEMNMTLDSNLQHRREELHLQALTALTVMTPPLPRTLWNFFQCYSFFLYLHLIFFLFFFPNNSVFEEAQ